MRSALLALGLAAACSAAGPLVAETIAITGGTIQTMGPAGVVENGTIVLVDGRIAAVGVGIAIPQAARRIDARQTTRIPIAIASASAAAPRPTVAQLV